MSRPREIMTHQQPDRQSDQPTDDGRAHEMKPEKERVMDIYIYIYYNVLPPLLPLGKREDSSVTD